MPGTFTVKAGFNLPGGDTGADVVEDDLEPVDIEYYEDFLSPVDQSVGGRQSHVLASSKNAASQRTSRTFYSGDLFGGQELGELGSGDRKMWMMVISVSSGEINHHKIISSSRLQYIY